MSAAEESIGRGKRKQPEWFEENQEELEALIEMKNEAQSRMLAVNSAAAKKDLRQQQQRNVKKAVDRAREGWIRRWFLKAKQLRKIEKLDGSASEGYSNRMIDGN